MCECVCVGSKARELVDGIWRQYTCRVLASGVIHTLEREGDDGRMGWRGGEHKSQR